MLITKVYIETADTSANVVTLRFEDDETVAEALVKVAAKLKLQITREEILTRYALVLQGIPASKYFNAEQLITSCVTEEFLLVRTLHSVCTIVSHFYFYFWGLL